MADISKLTSKFSSAKLSLRNAGKLVQVSNQLSHAIDAAHCTAQGPGLTGYIAQQLPTSFTIQAAGEGGAPATKGGQDFRIIVRGLNRVDPELVDKGDGTYVVKLAYPMSGKYEVRISLERSQIQGSPFEVTVRAAGRPAVPPQPYFGQPGAGRGDVLEWAEPEHTGGLPLASYSVWRLPQTRGRAGSREGARDSVSWELLATITQFIEGATRRYELPQLVPPRRSVHCGCYAISCTNSKGESERGMPGPPFEDDPVEPPPPKKEPPPPPPPDEPLIEDEPPRVPGFNPADGLLLLKRWDKEEDEEMDARFWFLIGGYRSRAAAEVALDEGDGSLMHRCALRRLQGAAAGFVGGKMVRRRAALSANPHYHTRPHLRSQPLHPTLPLRLTSTLTLPSPSPHLGPTPQTRTSPSAPTSTFASPLALRQCKRDLEMAVEHAEHVARLQHVLQQATEKARKAGGRKAACITATIFMEVEVLQEDHHEACLAPPPPPGPPLPPRARTQRRPARCIASRVRGATATATSFRPLAGGGASGEDTSDHGGAAEAGRRGRGVLRRHTSHLRRDRAHGAKCAAGVAARGQGGGLRQGERGRGTGGLTAHKECLA